MLPRTLEPEAMDSAREARDYDAMDLGAVNAAFAADFLGWHGPCRGGEILDVGTGTGRIPVLIAAADPGARVLGVDLAAEMLTLARYHASAAGLVDRVRFESGDAKALPHADGRFEAVVSNSILHHVPEPAAALAEIARLVAPGGSAFVRDLMRPGSADAVEAILDLHAGGEGPQARDLFRASLHAALTLDEVRSILGAVGLDPGSASATSDRHWTIRWRRPS